MTLPEAQNTARSRQTALWAAVILASGFALGRLSTWPVKLRYPGEQNYVEGMRLVEMVHLREGVPIYAPPSAEGFDASIYGPLYYLVGARLVDPAAPDLLLLRVLSLVATLGCAAGCAVLACWLTGNWVASLLSALIFLSYSMVTMHGISARCDLVALCVFFWGFLFAFRFRASPLVLLAVPLMLLGFFYKQQFVAGPLSVVLFLLMERRYRLAAAFAGLMGGGGAGLTALFQFVVFPGQEFINHFVHYNLLPFTWLQFQGGVFVLALVFLVPLLVALEALRVRREKFLAIYLLLAWFFALTAVAKVGSESNYLVEPICIMSALFAATVADRASQGTELPVLLGFSLFFGQFLALPNPSARDFEKDRAIQNYFRDNFPPESAALSCYPGDLLRAGLSSPVSDIYQYAKLIRKGTLSDAHLLSALETRRFKVVIVTCDIEQENSEPPCVSRYLTPQLAKAIVRNYRLARRLELPSPERLGPEESFYAWVPKPAAENPASPP